jgi:hypothetical protein
MPPVERQLGDRRDDHNGLIGKPLHIDTAHQAILFARVKNIGDRHTRYNVLARQTPPQHGRQGRPSMRRERQGPPQFLHEKFNAKITAGHVKIPPDK